MKSDNIEAIYRLSPTQEGILFHSLSSPGESLYFNQFCCTIQGDLNRIEFRKAWELVTLRHSVLRTLFTWERRSNPLQIVRKHVELPWEFHDWQLSSLPKNEEELAKFLDSDRHRGFDLTKAPLSRVTLFQLSPSRYQLLWTFHHLILDGWSMRLLLKEVFQIYGSLCNKETPKLPTPRPFQEFINWLNRQDLAAAEGFWKTNLIGFSKPNLIGLDGRASTLNNHQVHHDYASFNLTEITSTKLQSLAKEHRITLNTIIQGSWALLLHHYCGDSDIVFGTTVSGRPANLEGAGNMIGLFINTLPLRIRIEPEATIFEWLKEIQKSQIELNEFEYSPLVKIQGWSEISRGQSLFETVLVFENHPTDNTMNVGEYGITFGDSQYFERSNYPLALLVVPGKSIEFIIVYDSHKFLEKQISSILNHLNTLLNDLVANPNQKSLALQILSEEEKRQLLEEWNGLESNPLENTCWIRNFEAGIEKYGQNQAVVYKDHELSYDQLNERANKLAHYLADNGVKANTLVGIFLGRSIDMIVSILATQKAGGAYVPLDPMYPQERIKFMLEDTKVPILLTSSEFLDNLPSSSCKIVCINSDWEIINPYPDSNTLTEIDPSDLAYVIYTSGSSGQPKGVMITHGNLYHSTEARHHYYKEPVKGFLLFSTYAFDSSVAGIFWTLTSGGTLYLPEDERFMEPPYLAQLIQKNSISHLLCVPSFYELLLKDESPSMRSLMTVIVAGEVCHAGLVSTHFELMETTSLFNEYGPTEATVWSTVFQCKKETKSKSVPIGRPLPNTKVYLLNSSLTLAPPGVAAELFIGGNGLAAGYWNRPDLTNEKFISNPFSENLQDRLYRTGDLVRFLEDGILEFIGRNDDQIKLRGYRIELDEISNIIKNHPAIEQSLVLLQEENNPQSDESEEDNLEIEKSLDLEEMMNSIDPGVFEKLLAEIEEIPESTVLNSLAEENIGQNPSPFIKESENEAFKIQIKLKDDHFIKPPRKTQREWLLNQLIHEVSADLKDLDCVTRTFVPGHDMMNRGYITNASEDQLPDQVILEDWQVPIMKAMAEHVSENHGDLLEIGFGRGVSASFIQEAGVRSHTIVECNEYSIKNFYEPWRKRFSDAEIHLVKGRWEDHEADLGLFDSVFFHAFPLDDEEFITYVVNSITFAEHFFPVASKHLRKGGIFTYLTTEINSLSRRHQRALFKYFRSLTISVEPLSIPADTKDAWWADSMVIIKAVK